MDKEYISAVLENKNNLLNKKVLIKIVGLTIFLCSLPIILFNESGIATNNILNAFIDFMNHYFLRIEGHFHTATSTNLSNTLALQMSWSIIVILVIFIISFYHISKVYLCSLGYKKLDRELYYDTMIKYTNSHTNLFTYIFSIIVVLFLFDYFLLGYLHGSELGESYLYLSVFFRTTELGSIIYTTFISLLFGTYFAYLIVEFIAQVRKSFFNIKGIK